MAVSEITLETWDQIHAYQKDGWIYRGQRSSEWGLRTSLERCCARQKMELRECIQIESNLRREFGRAYHRYGKHIPKTSAPIEWLSLMQHYGTPTRLLDFTYSIYVAAYFALECAEKACAVWAANGFWATHDSVAAYAAIGRDRAVLLASPTQEKHERVAANLLFKAPFAKAAIQLTPYWINERLRTQRGTFLAPGDVSVSFEENLISLPGHTSADNIVKIIIPEELLQQGIKNLYEMNISRSSLFPGLDGYAQSLGIYHPSFSPYRNETLTQPYRRCT